MRLLALLALAGCATASPDDLLAAQFARPPADLAERAQDLAMVLAAPPADPAAAAALARETQTVARLVADDIAGEHTPLAEEARAQRYAAFLVQPAVRWIGAELQASILAAGRAKCAALDASTPFASVLASRYCAHFGVTRAPLALPDRYGSLAIDDEITAEPTAERGQLAQQLDAALRASPWYAPGARALQVKVTGSFGVTFTRTPVTRSVPYTAEVVGTVDGYHGPVGITLDVPRDFAYAAIEETGSYAAQLHVDVEPLAIGASEANSFSEQGDSTDISNPEAHVSPTRANLQTAEGFATSAGDVLAANLHTELTRGFVESACQDADASYEAAAKCAYGDPARAVPQLLSVFGNDAALLRPLLQ